MPNPASPSVRTAAAALLLASFFPTVTHAADPAPAPPSPATASESQAFKPGQKISALLKDKWREATVVEVKDNSLTVSPTYAGQKDSLFTYDAIFTLNNKPATADSLKPGQAVEVLTIHGCNPARVVATGPETLVVRWESGNSRTLPIEIPLSDARPAPAQPKPDERPVSIVTAMEARRLGTLSSTGKAPEGKPPGSRIREDLTYQPEKIRIQLVDAANKPLPSFTLNPPAGRTPLTTNDNGDLLRVDFIASPSYDITINNRLYRILPKDGNFSYEGVYPLPIADKAAPDIVDLKIQVLLPSGAPAVGAWVCVSTLYREGSTGSGAEDWSWLQAKTDAQGYAQFKMPPLNHRDLGRKNAVNFAEFVAHLPTAPGAPAILPATYKWEPGKKLQLQFTGSKTRKLLITDATGAPLSAQQLKGIKVTRPNLQDMRVQPTPVQLDPSQPYPFPDGTYNVEFPSGITRDFTIDNQSPDQIAISLKPAYAMSGRVLTPSGKPAPNTRVVMVDSMDSFRGSDLGPDAYAAIDKAALLPRPFKIFPLSLPESRSIVIYEVATTDKDGRFTIQSDYMAYVYILDPALLTLRAYIDRDTLQTPDLYAIPYGTVTFTPTTLQPNASGQAKLQILYADDKTPKALTTMRISDMGNLIGANLNQPQSFQLPAGHALKIKLTLDKNQYQSQTLTLKPGETLDLGKIALTNAPASEFSLVAADAQGVPLPGVKLAIASPDGKFNTTATTDAAGNLSVNLPPNTAGDALRITFTPPSGKPLTARILNAPSRDGRNTSQTFALFPQEIKTIPISGDLLLTDSAGGPLPNLPIQIDGFLGSQTLTTDARGKLPIAQINALFPYAFNITGPDKQRYLGFQHHRSLNTATFPIPVPGNTAFPVIEGQVLLPDGKPAANVLVGADCSPSMMESPGLQNAAPPRAGVFTDAQGRFRLSPTWNFQIAELSNPPKYWTVSAQGDTALNLGVSAASWSAPGKMSAPGKPVTLTLPKTRPVEVTFTTPPDLDPRLTQAALAHIDPVSNTRIMLAVLTPGTQTLSLPPGQYSVLGNRACSKPLTLTPDQSRLTCELPISQTYQFTFVDSQTQKPIPTAFIDGQVPIHILGSMDDKAWADLATNKNADKTPPNPAQAVLGPIPFGLANAQGVCTIQVANVHTSYGMMGAIGYAPGYVPAQVGHAAEWTAPNAQGIIDLRVQLQPGARIRILPDKPPANFFSRHQDDPAIQLNPLTAQDTIPQDGRRSVTLDPLLEGLIAPTQPTTVIVPKGKPLWLVAKANSPHVSFGTLTTESPTILWLTPDSVTPQSWTPTDVPLKLYETIPFNIKVVDASGNPVQSMLISPSIAGSNAVRYLTSTDPAGAARFNLPRGIKVQFHLGLPNHPAPLTNPAWTLQIPESQDPQSPLILTLPKGTPLPPPPASADNP
jgi:hypothetical protein